MATEIIYLEAKSDIKGVIKEVDDLNKSLKKTNDQFKDNARESKKSNKQILDLIGNFRIFGTSISQISRQFNNLTPLVGRFFGLIKSGIAATGIGILVLALAAVVTSMSKSVAGGKALADIMKVLGKGVKAVTKAVTFLGDGILSVFGYDSTAAVSEVEKLENAYKKLARQTSKNKKEVAAQGTQRLIYNKIINDETRSEKDRLSASTALFHLNKNNINAEEKIAKNKIKLNEKAVKNAEKRIKEGEGEKEAQEELNKLVIERNNLEGEISKASTARLKEFFDKNARVKDIKSTQNAIDKQESENRRSRYKTRKAEELTTEKEMFAAEIALAKQVQQIEDQIAYDILETQEDVERAKLQNAYDRSKLKIENSLATQQTIDDALRVLKIQLDSDLMNIEVEGAKELASVQAENRLLASEDSLEATRKLEDEKLLIQRDAEISEVADTESSERTKTAIKKKYSKIQGKINKKRGEDDVAMAKASTNDQISAFGNLAGALASLAGDNKELAAASAIIDTYVGANKAWAQGGIAGAVAAGAIIISGMANVKKIYETEVPGDDGGGGVDAEVPPAPLLMSGAFEVNDSQVQEPVRSYVVSDDITDSQNGLEIIRRRATI